MILGKAVNVVLNSVTPTWTRPELVSTMPVITGSGQSVSPEKSKNVATAYRCGNILSDDVAKMPLQTFVSRRPGEIERVRPNGRLKNIAYRLERKPNRWWSPFLFKKMAIQWLLYWGNALIWMPPSGNREMFLLPINQTQPLMDVNANLWFMTRFRGDPLPTPIPAVEVLHLMINPDESGMWGRSIITYARETIGRQLSAYAMQNTLYKQGLSAAGILWLDGESKPEMRTKVREMYEETMSGYDNNSRIAILDKKVSKFEAITMKPVDVQFLQGMQQNDAEVANYFGMPLHKINLGKQSYESNTAQQLDYLSTTVDPYLVQWEDGAETQWLTEEEQEYTYFRFERSALLRTDPKSRGEYLNGAINNGRLTPNEGRQIEDRPADLNPAANKLYMPSNIQPMGESQQGAKTNAQ